MVREIEFSELEHLLYNIGFVTLPTTGSQKVYQYPSSGTLVVLPGYEQQAYVRTVPKRSCTSDIVRKWFDG